MKRSFHCISEETATNPEDVKKLQIQQILRNNNKTQFVFDFTGIATCDRMNSDLIDVVIGVNAYGLYRFVGLTSPMFDGLMNGALIMDKLIPTCDFTHLTPEITRHVLRLSVDLNPFYGFYGLDYLYKLITDWQETKYLLVSLFLGVGPIADLCLWYCE
jgi:hypothetical protein